MNPNIFCAVIGAIICVGIIVALEKSEANISLLIGAVVAYLLFLLFLIIKKVEDNERLIALGKERLKKLRGEKDKRCG
ncbi:MAG: hypothetical protein V1768_03480 [Patescibacteria group bacterium]